MGRHATEQRGRTFAPWIIIATIALVTLTVVTVAYVVVVIRSNNNEAGTCKSALALPVAAGPSAARMISEAARAYNATAPVVRSACVTVGVTGVPDDDALAGLSGLWRTKNGPRPGMWIPESTASLAALDATHPELAAGHPTDPFAWSPVVLATAAAEPLPEVTWADLLDTQDETRAIDPIISPVIGNRAVSYALQSALSGPDATKPVATTTVTVHSSTLRTAVATMPVAATTAGALERLAETADTGSGTPVVPVVEADLVQYNRQADTRFTAVHPSGVTVGDALIGTPISAQWTDRTITAAASDFLGFLSSPAGQQILADHGWRTVSAHPTAPQPQVDTAVEVTMIPAGGPAVDEALAVALGEMEPTETSTSTPPSTTTSEITSPTTSSETPTTEPTTTTTEPPEPELATDGPILTLVIDTSEGMSAEDDGESLLTWVQRALPELLDGSVTDRIGLWVYADGGVYPPTGSPELVPNGVITKKVKATMPDGDTAKMTRSEALTDAIKQLLPDGERWAYGAVMEALPVAAELGRGDRQNRVLLVTSGADDTPGTLRRQVLDAVRATADSVRLDVIGLGSAVPVDAYTDIAAAGGGEYVPVIEPEKLGQQLVDFLVDED